MTAQMSTGFRWLGRVTMMLMVIAAGPGPAEATQATPGGTGTITGQVIERETGVPMAGVHVMVQGTRLAQVTDAQGGFEISGVPAGARTVVARAIGHTEARSRVTVIVGGDVTVSLTLVPDAISLAGLVVQAESELPTEAGVLNYPAARVVVSNSAIHEQAAAYPEEVLQKLPGIYIQDETGTGGKPNIGVRGLDPRRSQWVAILVDDIPVEPAPYGFTGLSIFPYLMERTSQIDVLRGGVAVRHGPNTVGGVISMMTTPIPQRPSLNVRQAFGSDAYWSNNISVGTTRGATGVLAEFVNKRGDGPRQNMGFEMYNWNVKVRQELSSATYVTVGVDGYHEPNSQLAGGLSRSGFDEFGRTHTEHPFDFFIGQRYGANARLYSQLGPGQFRLLTYGYATERNFGLDRPGGARIRETPRHMRTLAIEPRYSVDVGSRSTLTFGIRQLREDADFWAPEYDIDSQGRKVGDTVLRDSTTFFTNATALFVDNRIQVTDDLVVYPGLRIERVATDARRSIVMDAPRDDLHGSTEFTEYLPGFSAMYRALDNVRLFANYNRAFRSPQFVHLELDPDRSGLQEFTAERSNNFEVGTRVGPIRGAYVEGTVFQIDFDNQVQRDPDFENVFRNIGRTLHRGFETRAVVAFDEVSAALNGLELNGGYTFVDSEIRSGEFVGNDVPKAPRHRTTWGAKYEAPVGVVFVVDGLHVGSTFTDAENTVEEPTSGAPTRGILPAYRVINAGVLYTLPRFNLTLGAHGKNLTDELYFSRDSRGIMPAPGRTWIIQASTTVGRR